MKLRLRSFESKETLKIEASNTSSLHQLKQIISQTLANSPNPHSIRLSLNRKDELQSDTEESLQELGIAGRDLIFYSLDQAASFTNPSSQKLNPVKPTTTVTSVFPNPECSISLNPLADPQNSNSVDLTSQKRKTLDSGAKVGETVDNMEVDEEVIYGNDGAGGDFMDVVEERLSVPGFLRKLLVEELGGDSGSNHKLIVIAVHAVLMESGFVGFDPIANTIINGFNFCEVWPSPFKLSLFFTLPEIVTGAQGNHSIVLKFQPLGKFMNVYGSLGSGGSGKTNMVRLNEDQLVPFLNVVWANCGANENVSILDTTAEKEVFKFWRNVKDNLALPLLIDICEKAGFDLPPCFMRLPSDLKLKILETLPGVDVAKVGCVCSELQYLASSDELWKLKFGEEFDKDVKAVQGSWRTAFARKWEIRKFSRKFTGGSRVAHFPHRYRQRYPQPVIFQHPRIIGGEYDLSGDFGNPGNLLNNTRRLFGPATRLRRNFSPNCNLGGLGI